MTPREELIETMAREAFRQERGVGWTVFRDAWLQGAAIMLATIEAHNGGCMVVPSANVTERMLHILCTDRGCWDDALAASPYAPEKPE